MGPDHLELNRQVESFARQRTMPGIADLVFTVVLSTAVFAGLALGFVF